MKGTVPNYFTPYILPRIKLANTIPIPIPGPNKASVQYPAPKYLKLVFN